MTSAAPRSLTLLDTGWQILGSLMKNLNSITGVFLSGIILCAQCNETGATERNRPAQITDVQLLLLSNEFAAEIPPTPDELFPYMLYRAIEAQYPGILDPARLGIEVTSQVDVTSTVESSDGVVMMTESDDPPPLPGPPPLPTTNNISSGYSQLGVGLIISTATNGWHTLTITNAGAQYLDVYWTSEAITNADWNYWFTSTSTTRTNVFAQPGSGNAFFCFASQYDGDGDSLPDAYERWVSKTNPNHNDTDGDYVYDNIEIMQGLDPNNGSDACQAWVCQPASHQLP